MWQAQRLLMLPASSQAYTGISYLPASFSAVTLNFVCCLSVVVSIQSSAWGHDTSQQRLYIWYLLHGGLWGMLLQKWLCPKELIL